MRVTRAQRDRARPRCPNNPEPAPMRRLCRMSEFRFVPFVSFVPNVRILGHRSGPSVPSGVPIGSVIGGRRGPVLDPLSTGHQRGPRPGRAIEGTDIDRPQRARAPITGCVPILAHPCPRPPHSGHRHRAPTHGRGQVTSDTDRPTRCRGLGRWCPCALV